MPLSSNLVVKPVETSLTGEVELESGPRRAIQRTEATLKSIGHGILVFLDAIGFYDRVAAEQKRLEAERKRAEEAGEEVVDPRLPRDLIAGIMIAMPSPSKAEHDQQNPESEPEEYDERLPDVALGVFEKPWQAGVD